MRQVQSFPTPLKKARRNKALSRFIYVIVVLVVLFIGLGLLSHIPRITINEINVTGTKVINDDDVRKSALSYLDNNVALVYSRGNIFIYSKKKLAEHVKENFPRVYEVKSVTRTKQKIDIDIEERQAKFTWCGHVAPTYEKRFEKRDCYFLDQTGFIFDVSPFFTDGVYLTFYGGIQSDMDPIGQTIATKNRIIDFGDATSVFALNGLPAHSVVIKPDGQNEFLLDLISLTGDFAKILFNESSEISDIKKKIDYAVAEEAFLEEFDDNSVRLEYIDTRFNNRVFYKFKEI